MGRLRQVCTYPACFARRGGNTTTARCPDHPPELDGYPPAASEVRKGLGLDQLDEPSIHPQVLIPYTSLLRPFFRAQIW